MKKKLLSLTISMLLPVLSVMAQPANSTAEDKLQSDSLSFSATTTIGGYGNAFYQRDFNREFSEINLERFVLFTGHKFNRQISFFSELEVEDAKVSGGESGGEIALEQCYLKFNIDQGHYLVAGLFIPRIGILNENHLPNSFNGNERTQVETFILPSTWRELGIGFYGTMSRLPFTYSVGLVNGLNSASFEHGSVIREGRFEGRNASANNLAVTGSLQMYRNNFRAQISGYYGGSVGLSPREADSLKLASGIFGTPVLLGEADVQYDSKGFSAKVLGTVLSIPGASDINRAYASNTPRMAYGVYAELGYNVFEQAKRAKGQQLILFTRYEILDMNASVPGNGIKDGTLKQQHIVAGFSYLPMQNVVVKADVRLLHTGNVNPDLVFNPNPAALPYKNNNTFLNLGIGYSF
jgi:hypothetical protein